jgi:hypothetical protein
VRAVPLTLTAVFGKDVRYVVPMFQRPYVWNMKEHWRRLRRKAVGYPVGA